MSRKKLNTLTNCLHRTLGGVWIFALQKSMQPGDILERGRRPDQTRHTDSAEAAEADALAILPWIRARISN
jgi:hypothetical protein